MKEFVLKSKYQPTGDQPQAIEKLTEGIFDGLRTQVLVGVTGSGKTFTMANIIKNVNRAIVKCGTFNLFYTANLSNTKLEAMKEKHLISSNLICLIILSIISSLLNTTSPPYLMLF